VLGLLAIALVRNAVLRYLAAYVEERQKEPPSTKLDPLPFADLPRWASRAIAPRRAEIMGLGFAELVTFAWMIPYSVSYSCVLVSLDKTVFAHVWVARASGPRLVLTLRLGWRWFLRHLLGTARWGFSSAFPGERRFQTSAIAYRNIQAAGELEFLTLPDRTPLGDALRQHREQAGAFAARNGGLDPIAVTTAEQLLKMEQELAVQLRERSARRREALRAPPR
jgi:hypothetical protein